MLGAPLARTLHGWMLPLSRGAWALARRGRAPPGGISGDGVSPSRGGRQGWIVSGRASAVERSVMRSVWVNLSCSAPGGARGEGDP